MQYFSPNLNGFTFRIATTNAQQDPGFQYFSGNDDILVTDSNGNTDEIDPRIWSTGVAYENTLASGDNVWFALTYEVHDDWAAVDAAVLKLMTTHGVSLAVTSNNGATACSHVSQ